ncbi:MAG: AAA family ATPase [Candidatus Nanoarchaeia archaeon]|jgi:ATP-dependent Clp protease ATP-binding subunit ClpX
MASDKEPELEDILRQGFCCDSLVSSSQKREEYRLNKEIGMQFYLEEKYIDAVSCFAKAIPKAGSKEEKSELCKRVIDCNKELLKRVIPRSDGSIKENFDRVWKSYTTLIEIDPTADNYFDYIHFIGNELTDYSIYLQKEAIQIAEIARDNFPEDARIRAELSSLYSLEERDKESYDERIAVCKLKYDDADFIVSHFGERIIEPDPDSGDASTIPMNIILNYKSKAVQHNAKAMYGYASYLMEKSDTNAPFTMWMFFKAYQYDPKLPDIKEKLFESKKKFMEYAKKTGIENIPQNVADTINEITKLQMAEAKNKRNKKGGRDTEEQEGTKEQKINLENPLKVYLPKEIKAHLDTYVIGQEQAKTGIAVGVYTHLLRVNAYLRKERIDKSNILILGPTGSGKTYIVKNLAEMMKVPFVIVDTSKVTSAGYVGDKAEECLERLLTAAEGNLKLAERGIVYLDEADKIKRSHGNGKDVGGEGAQQQYLKLLEGSEVHVEIGEGQQKHKVVMDTTNILFIVGGAFSDTSQGEAIKDKIAQREGEKRIGFNTSVLQAEKEGPARKNILKRLTDKDLQDYGFLPEFAGRLHYRIVLDPLTKNELRRILVEPKDAVIPQYEKIFKEASLNLKVMPEALDAIAEEAFKLAAGARSLRTICDGIFQEALFHLPGSSQKEYILTTEEVTRALRK